MLKRDLLPNKLCALLLIVIGLAVMLLDGDATALIFLSILAVPMFFAKENWIVGGCYEDQKGWRKGVRRELDCGREGSYADGDSAPAR